MVIEIIKKKKLYAFKKKSKGCCYRILRRELERLNIGSMKRKLCNINKDSTLVIPP